MTVESVEKQRNDETPLSRKNAQGSFSHMKTGKLGKILQNIERKNLVPCIEKERIV